MTQEMVLIKQVIKFPFIIGEGPHWEEEKKCLTFVDIKGGCLHRFFTVTGRWQRLNVVPDASGNTVNFIIPVKCKEEQEQQQQQQNSHQDQDIFADLYIIGHGRSLALIEWPESDPDTHTREVKVKLLEVEGHAPTNRFNDGKCDSKGRLWAGTMSAETSPGVLEKEKGHLYCLDSDLNLKTVLDKVSLSNGLAWSEDNNTFYYIDSTNYTVDAFDYDEDNAKIDNRRSILDFKQAGLIPDIPDGMCVDRSGNLWVACYGGGKIICINPETHKIIRKVGMPATNITSLCYGGELYDTLYVTSACQCMSQEEISAEGALGLFEISGLGERAAGPPSPFRIKTDVLKKLLKK